MVYPPNSLTRLSKRRQQQHQQQQQPQQSFALCLAAWSNVAVKDLIWLLFDTSLVQAAVTRHFAVNRMEALDEETGALSGLQSLSRTPPADHNKVQAGSIPGPPSPPSAHTLHLTTNQPPTTHLNVHSSLLLLFTTTCTTLHPPTT